MHFQEVRNYFVAMKGHLGHTLAGGKVGLPGATAIDIVGGCFEQESPGQPVSLVALVLLLLHIR